LYIAPLALALSASASCKSKPSEAACKDAINNMRKIYGQSASDVGADPKTAIRSCRGQSSKETVEFMRNAKTVEDLEKCEGEEGKKFLDEEMKADEERLKKALAGEKEGAEETGSEEPEKTE
jgi:hypothetical protein